MPNFDYAQVGVYFLTICTYQRLCLFGEISWEEMDLSEIGQIVNDEWLHTREIRPNVRLDVHQIMPNHLHAIVIGVTQLRELRLGIG